jgi:GT2 family glycosyltransferase
MKMLSVIIVNWNGKEDTIRCLQSLRSMRIPPGISLETVVVDNGSTDGSVTEIKKRNEWATVLETGENLGFTGGNNFGITYALGKHADFIWLLNNDTIVDRNAAKLTEAFEDGNVGVAGSKIYFAPRHEYHFDRYSESERGKVLWYAGGVIDWENMYASHRGVDEVDIGQYDKPEDTPFVTGCSLMTSRTVIKKIGMLDNRYYLYNEDLDYCLRAKKAGYDLRYYPNSKVWHINAGSSGGAGSALHQYYQTRNRLLTAFRYAPARTRLALVRESVRFLLQGTAVQKKAIMDAALGKVGRQYVPLNN